MKQGLKNIYMVYLSDGLNKVTFFNNFGERLYKPIHDKPKQKWAVTIYAILRNTKGEERIESIGYKWKVPKTSKEIGAFIEQETFRFIERECQVNHLVNIAQIYSIDREPRDELACTMLDKLGGWNAEAQWQTRIRKQLELN